MLQIFSMALICPGFGIGTDSAPLEALTHPTLELLRDRARPWPHLQVEPVLMGGPAAYYLRGLLTSTEIEALKVIGLDGMREKQQKQSKFQAMVSLDTLPHLNASDAVQLVNRRLSAITGLPEANMEEGYFSVYNAGHEMKALHMDNHHSLFDPVRVVSFVVYVVTDALKGGGTAFPFAGGEEQNSTLQDRMTSHSPEWWEWELERQSSLLGHRGTFQMGDDPQAGRICTDHNCPDIMARARQLCKLEASPGVGMRSVVSARAGDAVMFYGHNASGAQTAAFMHGSCGVDRGVKVVLAKFIRAGPKPWSDEREFTAALNVRRARGTPTPAPEGLSMADSQQEKDSSAGLGWVMGRPDEL